jgi:hypothetical protein
MKPLKQKPIKDYKYMYFDFEANQETGIHEMNYCIAYNGDHLYRLQPDSTTIFKGKFNITDIKLDKLNVDNISAYFTLTARYIYKDKVIDKFCKLFISNDFKGYTFISHFGKGYDMNPILGWLVKKKHDINVISSGLKITYIEVMGTGIRFIDSINFTLMALKGFPESFGFKGNKGYFPH